MATIAINLDDQATDGLKALTQELAKADQAVDGLSQSSDALTDVQRHQIEIIQKSATDWKTFGAEAVPAISETTKAGIGLAETIAEISFAGEKFAFDVGKQLIGTLSEGAVELGKYTIAAIGAVKAIKAFRGEASGASSEISASGDAVDGARAAMAGGAAAATAYAAGLTRISNAGWTVAKAVFGLGPTLLATKAEFAAMEAVLARTGERFDEFGKRTTNLDRTKEAVKSLSSEIKTNLMAGISGIDDWYSQLLGIDKAWKAIDVSVTKANDTFVENVKIVRGVAESWSLVSASTKEFDDRVKRTADDFERLREVTSKWGAQDEMNARTKAADKYAEKLAEVGYLINQNGQLEKDISDSTLAAAIARLDEEIRKRQEAAGELARTGRFTAEEQKKYDAEVGALRDARAERDQQLEQLRKQAALNRIEAIKKGEKEAWEEAYAANSKIIQLSEERYRQQQDLIRQTRQSELQAITDARNAFLDNVELRIKAEGDFQKAVFKADDADEKSLNHATDEEDAQIHTLKLFRIREETNDKIRAIKDESDDKKRASKDDIELQRATANEEKEIAKALADEKKRIAAEEASFKRAMLVKELQDEQDAAVEEIKAEKKKREELEKAKKEQQEAFDKKRDEVFKAQGITGENLLQTGKKSDVRKILQDQAREEAQEQTRLANQDLLTASNFDHSAMDEYRRRQKRAQDKAVAQANRDFAQGKTDPTKLADAQGQAAAKQIGAWQQQGKFSQDSVKAMLELLRVAAQNQAQTQQLQQQVDKIAQQAAAMNGRAAQQRQRAQGNSL
jgi:hypothetical protein